MPTQPFAFLSYARFDNDHRNGQIREIHARLIKELKSFSDIIKNGIESCVFFIPFISPSFYNSDYCRKELKLFLECEQKLGHNDRLLPILYEDTSRHQHNHSDSEALKEIIQQRQYKDFTPHAYREVTDREVLRFIRDLAETLVDTSRQLSRPISTKSGVVERSKDFIDIPQPAWSKTIGQDAFGIYADLEIQGITQRCRWLPPGRFVMGSPLEEVGRHDDEIPRRVTLSKGFWLVDTVCTQKLWMAIMNRNRSQFKGDALPVEHVSMEEVESFLFRLNKLCPDLQAGLPTDGRFLVSGLVRM